MKNEQTFNFDHLNNINDDNSRQAYRIAVINSFIQPLELTQERRMLEVKKLVSEMLIDFQKEKEFLKHAIDELEKYIDDKGYYGTCSSYEYEDFFDGFENLLQRNILQFSRNSFGLAQECRLKYFAK